MVPRYWFSRLRSMDALARATLREDVRILAGVPSWMLVVAKRVLELSGADVLGDVWPNLQLYMHGGVSFEPYRAEFQISNETCADFRFWPLPG